MEIIRKGQVMQILVLETIKHLQTCSNNQQLLQEEVCHPDN